MVTGILDVADRAAALVQIERLGLFPVAVEGAKGAAVAANERPARGKSDWKAMLPPALREALARQRRAKNSGARDLHAATRESLEFRDAAHRGIA